MHLVSQYGFYVPKIELGKRNIYALLIIVSTTIIFFSKNRLGQIEDETYKNFLIANIFMSISGLLLGLVVSPNSSFNINIIKFFNKIYLISLVLWIFIMTFYTVYVSLKDKTKVKDYKKNFRLLEIICIVIIVFSPIEVDILNPLKYEAWFRAKPKLFSDILQKFSSHASRLGISSINLT